MLNIYHRNILTPYFKNTNAASIMLILLPGFTNIYYMLRPHGIFKNIMMFGVPVACILNQTYCFRN
jgi:hypothetical protein